MESASGPRGTASWTARRDDEPRATQTLHGIGNHLAIIAGYADLLLADTALDDGHLADLRAIRKAADDALALVRQAQGDAARVRPSEVE